MNQNRNQNRRRGRGGNRGGQGGGNQGNRIDSRARGNAPQLLEKYRKLAHDASLNGDRVLTEYYLQFADHYFRVVADSRTQKDEQRPPRRDFDRDRDHDQPYEPEDYEAEDRGGEQREPRERPDDRYEDERVEKEESPRAIEGEDREEVSAEDNPFTRDTRGGARARSAPRGRGRGRPANDAADEAEEAVFDPGLLPPSIPREEEAPRPAKGRGRRPRPADDGDDEALEAAS